MEIVIDYNKFHDYICGFVDPYEIPAVENAVDKAMKRDLVRCGECKFYLWLDETCALVATRLHFFEMDKRWTKDCFCSWGERRADDE